MRSPVPVSKPEPDKISLCNIIVKCALISFVFFCGFPIETNGSSGLNIVQLKMQSEFNRNETFQINSSVQQVLVYRLNASLVNVTNANFEIKTRVLADKPEPESPEELSIELNCPITFSLRQGRSSKFWSLPNEIIVQGKDSKLGELETDCVATELQYSKETTVCLDSDNLNALITPEPEPEENILEFVVGVSTCRRTNVTYSILFSFKTTGFLLALHSPIYGAKVTPTIDRLHRFNFPPDIDLVTVQVESEDAICMRTYVQSALCPLNTVNSNQEELSQVAESLHLKRVWQDMTRRTYIRVHRSDYPSGFFVMFAVDGDDNKCKSKYKKVSFPNYYRDRDRRGPSGTSFLNSSSSTETGNGPCFTGTGGREKTFNLNIAETDQDRTMSFLWPLAVPFIMTVLVIGFTVLVYCIDYKYWEGSSRRRTSASALDAVEILTKNGEELLTMKHFVQSHSNPEKSYFEICLYAVGMYFLFPNSPLTFMWEQVAQLRNPQNDQNVCYRNYLCSHKWWLFNDVNHMYMNVFTILLGVTFLFFVFHYQRKYRIVQQQQLENVDVSGSTVKRTASNKNYFKTNENDNEAGALAFESIDLQESIPNAKENTGVFDHFDVFYIQGVALIMQGILSMAYHTCPTHKNFPFDYSAFFILALLSIIKIYQFRHSGSPFSQKATFKILSLILVITSMGISLSISLDKKYFFLINLFVFVFINLIIVPMTWIYLRSIKPNAVQGEPPLTGFPVFVELMPPWLQTNYLVFQYFPGIPYIIADSGFKFALYVFRHPRDCFNSYIRTELVTYLLLILVFGMNIFYAVLQLFFWEQSDFSRYLGVTLVFNALLYLSYYMYMKFLYNEMTNKQSLIYFTICVALVLSILVSQLFIMSTYDPTVSLAESRVFNRPCINTFFLDEFYDAHDFLHLISAGVIFFYLMTLLTIDDGILRTPRNQIVVF